MTRFSQIDPNLGKFGQIDQKKEGFFFAFCIRKKSKILYFLISLVEIWLVLLKLKILVSCHSQIGLMFKNGQK